LDEIDPVKFNRKAWDDMALAGDKYYHAVTTEQLEAARAGDWKIRITPQKPVPREWLEPTVGQKILCLAGGGGQQAPILAAAGAEVTVFDLSDRQLERDRKIAGREGMEIRTFAGDMTNLSCFADQEFDLIVNPCSVCFCPEVHRIWQECYRILKKGGSLITGFINPVHYLFDAIEMDDDNFVVRHKIPYSDFDLPTEERDRVLGNERPREFGHSLQQLIGQQLDAGFALTGFYEDGWGDNDKLSSMISLFCGTRATVS
jgi:SAM-dependent methyltransferase